MESSETSQSDFEELDENFHIGRDVFILPNGDSYDGEYVAHRNGLVWREGYGTYTTSDGQVYTGRWYNDKLKENRHLRISYADGLFYEGKLMNNKYFGPGRYGLSKNLEISCEFVDNKPVGEVIMMDHRAKVWCEYWIGKRYISDEIRIQYVPTLIVSSSHPFR